MIPFFGACRLKLSFRPAGLLDRDANRILSGYAVTRPEVTGQLPISGLAARTAKMDQSPSGA
jgi:hypothetical protein